MYFGFTTSIAQCLSTSLALTAHKCHATFWNWLKCHQNRNVSAVLVSSCCPSAMAGLVSNSLLVFIPYSGNGLSLCVVLVHRSSEVQASGFLTRENSINLASFVVWTWSGQLNALQTNASAEEIVSCVRSPSSRPQGNSWWSLNNCHIVFFGWPAINNVLLQPETARKQKS